MKKQSLIKVGGKNLQIKNVDLSDVKEQLTLCPMVKTNTGKKIADGYELTRLFHEEGYTEFLKKTDKKNFSQADLLILKDRDEDAFKNIQEKIFDKIKSNELTTDWGIIPTDSLFVLDFDFGNHDSKEREGQITDLTVAKIKAKYFKKTPIFYNLSLHGLRIFTFANDFEGNENLRIFRQGVKNFEISIEDEDGKEIKLYADIRGGRNSSLCMMNFFNKQQARKDYSNLRVAYVKGEDTTKIPSVSLTEFNDIEDSYKINADDQEIKKFNDQLDYLRSNAEIEDKKEKEKLEKQKYKKDLKKTKKSLKQIKTNKKSTKTKRSRKKFKKNKFSKEIISNLPHWFNFARTATIDSLESGYDDAFKKIKSSSHEIQYKIVSNALAVIIAYTRGQYDFNELINVFSDQCETLKLSINRKDIEQMLNGIKIRFDNKYSQIAVSTKEIGFVKDFFGVYPVFSSSEVNKGLKSTDEEKFKSAIDFIEERENYAIKEILDDKEVIKKEPYLKRVKELLIRDGADKIKNRNFRNIKISVADYDRKSALRKCRFIDDKDRKRAILTVDKVGSREYAAYAINKVFKEELGYKLKGKTITAAFNCDRIEELFEDRKTLPNREKKDKNELFKKVNDLYLELIDKRNEAIKLQYKRIQAARIIDDNNRYLGLDLEFVPALSAKVLDSHEEGDPQYQISGGDTGRHHSYIRTVSVFDDKKMHTKQLIEKRKLPDGKLTIEPLQEEFHDLLNSNEHDEDSIIEIKKKIKENKEKPGYQINRDYKSVEKAYIIKTINEFLIANLKALNGDGAFLIYDENSLKKDFYTICYKIINVLLYTGSFSNENILKIICILLAILSKTKNVKLDQEDIPELRLLINTLSGFPMKPDQEYRKAMRYLGLSKEGYLRFKERFFEKEPIDYQEEQVDELFNKQVYVAFNQADCYVERTKKNNEIIDKLKSVVKEPVSDATTNLISYVNEDVAHISTVHAKEFKKNSIKEFNFINTVEEAQPKYAIKHLDSLEESDYQEREIISDDELKAIPVRKQRKIKRSAKGSFKSFLESDPKVNVLESGFGQRHSLIFAIVNLAARSGMELNNETKDLIVNTCYNAMDLSDGKYGENEIINQLEHAYEIDNDNGYLGYRINDDDEYGEVFKDVFDVTPSSALGFNKKYKAKKTDEIEKLTSDRKIHTMIPAITGSSITVSGKTFKSSVGIYVSIDKALNTYNELNHRTFNDGITYNKKTFKQNLKDLILGISNLRGGDKLIILENKLMALESDSGNLINNLLGCATIEERDKMLAGIKNYIKELKRTTKTKELSLNAKQIGSRTYDLVSRQGESFDLDHSLFAYTSIKDLYTLFTSDIRIKGDLIVVNPPKIKYTIIKTVDFTQQINSKTFIKVLDLKGNKHKRSIKDNAHKVIQTRIRGRGFTDK